jgi:hypothetical protein
VDGDFEGDGQQTLVGQQEERERQQTLERERHWAQQFVALSAAASSSSFSAPLTSSSSVTSAVVTGQAVMIRPPQQQHSSSNPDLSVISSTSSHSHHSATLSHHHTDHTRQQQHQQQQQQQKQQHSQQKVPEFSFISTTDISRIDSHHGDAEASFWSQAERGLALSDLEVRGQRSQDLLMGNGGRGQGQGLEVMGSSMPGKVANKLFIMCSHKSMRYRSDHCTLLRVQHVTWWLKGGFHYSIFSSKLGTGALWD